MADKIKLKAYTLDICGKFDELLESSGIKLPDDDSIDSLIYATTYFRLRDEITEILSELVSKIKETPDIDIE